MVQADGGQHQQVLVLSRLTAKDMIVRTRSVSLSATEDEDEDEDEEGEISAIR